MAKPPKVRVIRAIFFGYQASGKTTFLAAALLDAQQPRQGPKLNIVTVAASGNDNKKLDERKAELAASQPVAKTRYVEGILRYDLLLQLAGKDPIRIHTIDFPGEAAGEVDVEDERKRKMTKMLNNELRQADCLFLFFDAELRHRKGMSDEERDRYAGQVNAIAQAASEFSKSKPDNPVTVVVTKADRINQIRARGVDKASALRSLNRNPLKAKKLFKSLFGENARQILKSRQGAAYVRYIASLGARPVRRVIDARSIYYIGELDDWQPLGLKEALEEPLERTWKIQTGKTLGQRVQRHRWAIGVCLLLMLLLAFWLSWDLRTASNLRELFATYERDNVPVEQVHQEALEADKPYHPFLYFPGRLNTVLGQLPAWPPSASVHEIGAELEHRVLADRLDDMTAIQGETFKEDYTDLEAASSAVDRELNRWLKLFDDVVERRDQLRGAPRARVLEELEKPAVEAFAIFIRDSIELVWKVAARDVLDATTVEPLVRTYVQQFESLLGRVEQREFVLATLDDLRLANTTGKCEVLVERYRAASLETASNYQGLFSLLSDLCLKCAEAPQRESVCRQLAERASLWDYYEAKALYDAFPRNWANRLPTRELFDLFESYRSHVGRRKAAVARHRGLYERQAGQFMKWHGSLNRSYSVSSIRLTFSQSLGPRFLTTEQEARTRSSGYDDEVYFVDVPVPPEGKLEILTDQSQDEVEYGEGWSTATKSPIKFDWAPGKSLTIRIHNRKSGLSLERQLDGFYLPYQLREGVSLSGVDIRFEGLDLPAVQPRALPAVVPPAR